MKDQNQNDNQQTLLPAWKRIGKGILAAGIAAAYITGVVLAAPITLGITATLGAVRGYGQRHQNKDGRIYSVLKGAFQGMAAPLAASATLAMDAARGEETKLETLLKSGTVVPGSRLPANDRLNKQNQPLARETGQPLWKRVGKALAGAAMIAGTITACAIAGPVVATLAVGAAVTGGYKGYKENGIWGAVKGAVNRVLSPITTGVTLMAHGVKGCETKMDDITGLDVFSPKNAMNKILPPPEKSLGAAVVADQGQKPDLPPRLKPELRGAAASRLQETLVKPQVNLRANERNPQGQLPPALPPKTPRGRF